MIPRTLIIVVIAGILTSALGLVMIFYNTTAWEEYKRTQAFQDQLGGRDPDIPPPIPIPQETRDWINAMKNEIVYPYRDIGLFVVSGGIVFTACVLASYQIAKETKRQ